MNYKIAVFGVKDTTRKILQHLTSIGHKADLLVTIHPSVLQHNHVSGFTPLEEVVAQAGINVFKIKNYSMTDDESKEFFASNTFDIGISMGWQRLIPETVLDRFKYGVFGLHGSCGYLPFGRGRSPMNWSIILGDTRFIMNLFRYDKNADSPNVYRQTMFEITPYDTIRTLQYKNIICAKRMITALVQDYDTGNIKIKNSSQDYDSWYKKRTPEDGKIDFHSRTRDIYNLIRGITRPFPGAFAFCREQRVIIWKAIPFDQILDFSSYSPGQIIEIFDGNLLVRTVDGSLLITEYETEKEVRPSDILS